MRICVASLTEEVVAVTRLVPAHLSKRVFSCKRCAADSEDDPFDIRYYFNVPATVSFWV